MRYQSIGQTGISASVVGVGTWAISGWMWGSTSESESIRALHAALDAGINLIDTAPAYGVGLAEKIVGQAIMGRRDKVVLATKCGLIWHMAKGEFRLEQDGKSIYQYLGAESIRHEVEESLKRLGVDCIDLYQVHWPDPNTPIPETMTALLDLKREGKIRAIGLSNTSCEQLDAYRAVGPIDSDQEEYHMLDRDHEAGLLPYLRRNGIAFLAYSPLAQGLLTGKIDAEREFPEGDLRREYPRFSLENRRRVAAMLDRFKPIVQRRKITLGQLAIAWTISSAGATHSLVGVRHPGQAIENALAADVILDQDELDLIDRAIRDHAADIPHLW